MALETHTSPWTTTSQAMVRGGGRQRSPVLCVDCTIDWEETESCLLAWPSHSMETRPVTGQMCTFKMATGELLHFNTDAVKLLH